MDPERHLGGRRSGGMNREVITEEEAVKLDG